MSQTSLSAITQAFMAAVGVITPQQPQGGRGTRRPRIRDVRDTGPWCKAAYGKPAPYAQLAPKVDGVRMRWQGNKLVPRREQPA